MQKKILILTFFLLFALFLPAKTARPINALPLSILAATATCDPCGDCGGGQKPADWDKCNACVSQEGHAWTVIGCLPTSAAGFIQKILQFAVSLAGGISFLVLLFAGFKILTSKGDVAQLASGKNLLVSSIVALFLILFAVFILRFIGFEILKIPGFGG